MTGTNCDLFTHKSSRSYLNHLVLACTYSIYITMHTKFPLPCPRFFLYPLRIGNTYLRATVIHGSFILSDFHHTFLVHLLSLLCFMHILSHLFVHLFGLLSPSGLNSHAIFLHSDVCLYDKQITRIECGTKCDVMTNILFESKVLLQLKKHCHKLGVTIFHTVVWLSTCREMYAYCNV